MAESNEQSAEKLPVVAIVGRPNVGKSTLFNRVVGKRLAIVEEKPKVTRDRKEVKAMWAGREFELVDTGGWTQGGDALDEKVSAQAEAAARLANLVIFVVDVTVGITEDDAAAARMLQRSRTPCVVAVNKVDSEKLEPSIWEFSALGLGTPWPISALHGRSSGDLLDHVVETVDAPFERFDDELDLPGARGFDKERNEKETAVAIVGRPNVGKSTLFNRLIGADRSVTHDMPGTTTDSIDTVIERDGHQLRFIDTAGLRRKSKIGDGTEYFSMVRSLKAIDDADISLLVIDARDGVTAQDQRLAERIDIAGSPALVLLNKWDLLSTYEKENLESEVANKLGFLAYLMPIRISALSGHNVVKIWAAIDEARTAYRSRIPTRELNKLMESIQIAHPPKNTKILYAVQGATDPPTMTLFTTKAVEPTYLRYIENRIRERFGLGTTPLKLRVRRRTH
ncbi:MAG: ribosome biogenesis GTPase Der [Acidimicrobiales bacterium]